MDDVVATLLRVSYRDGYFVMPSPRGEVVCAHVNGLTGWALAQLNSEYVPVAHALVSRLRQSPLWASEYELFYREMLPSGEVTCKDINLTKNVTLALLMTSCGERDLALRLVASLKTSALYRPDGLFERQINADGTLWRMVGVQGCLWYALLLRSLDLKEEAAQIWTGVQKEFVDSEKGLLASQNCELTEMPDGAVPNWRHEFLADDQALAVLVATALGDARGANEIVASVVHSPLYHLQTGLLHRSWSVSGSVDPVFTAYKNGLWALALAVTGQRKLCERARLGIRAVLFDPSARLYRSSDRDGSFIPDNVMLAHLGMEWPVGKLLF